VISWQDGLCGGLRGAKDGFSVRREVRFAVVFSSIMMLITSYIVTCILYHRCGFLSSEFIRIKWQSGKGAKAQRELIAYFVDLRG